MSITTTIPMTAESRDRTPSPTVCAPDTVPGGGNTPLVLHSESKGRGETVGNESSESDNRPKSGYKESDLRGRAERSGWGSDERDS